MILQRGNRINAKPMGFYQKYELDRLIADGEVRTFRATENATGRLVFLHLFNPEGQPLLAALKAKLARDPLKPVPPLVELGEFAGSPYAVTEPVTPFKSLREWLAQIAEPPSGPIAAPAPPPRPQARPPQEKSDEFARLFEKPAQPDPPRAPGAFTKLFEKPSKPAPRAGPGEFTKLFARPAPRDKPPAPPPPKPKPSESTQLFGPSPDRSDEFSKLFGGPKQPPIRHKTPPPSNPIDTGQFTSLFGLGASSDSINIEEEQAKAAKTAPPESRPFQGPSEFTRVFGPQGGSPRAAPKPRPHTIGSASGLFRARGLKAPVPSPPAPPEAEKGPGEYTRIIARATLDPKQPGAAQLMPAPPPKRGLMIGLAIFAVVLVVVVIVVIVIAAQKP
jgi:hypothetical protein